MKPKTFDEILLNTCSLVTSVLVPATPLFLPSPAAAARTWS